MTDGTTGIAGVDAAVVWIGVITALAGALGMLWRLTRGVRRIATRVEEFADDWQGTEARPGVPARPGVMERLARMERYAISYDDRLQAIEHELHPNSGGSLRDAVDRVERSVCAGGEPAPDGSLAAV